MSVPQGNRGQFTQAPFEQAPFVQAQAAAAAYAGTDTGLSALLPAARRLRRALPESALLLLWPSALRVPAEIDPLFEITAENVDAIVEICSRLDGLPLAIELAAAWMGALGVPEIVSAVRGGLGMLSTAALDVPARQMHAHEHRFLGDDSYLFAWLLRHKATDSRRAA